jgi:hypothetical protein
MQRIDRYFFAGIIKAIVKMGNHSIAMHNENQLMQLARTQTQ